MLGPKTAFSMRNAVKCQINLAQIVRFLPFHIKNATINKIITLNYPKM